MRERLPLWLNPAMAATAFFVLFAIAINVDDVRNQQVLFLAAYAIVVYGIVVATPFCLIQVRRQRELRRRHEGYCVRCGYDLTGNRSGVCPECGHRVGVAA